MRHIKDIEEVLLFKHSLAILIYLLSCQILSIVLATHGYTHIILICNTKDNDIIIIRYVIPRRIWKNLLEAYVNHEKLNIINKYMLFKNISKLTIL